MQVVEGQCVDENASVLIYRSRDWGSLSLSPEALVIRSQFMDVSTRTCVIRDIIFSLAGDSTHIFSTFLVMEYLCPSTLVSLLCSKHCQILVFGFLFLGSKQTTLLLLSHSCLRCVNTTVPGPSFLTLGGLLNTLPFLL